jgi:hypothetical protein
VECDVVTLHPATNCKKKATLTQLIVWSCGGLIVVILHRELSGSAAVVIHVDKLPQDSDVFLYIIFLKRFYGPGSSVSMVSGYGLDDREIEV